MYKVKTNTKTGGIEMNKFVLVQVKNGNYKIGVKRYDTKEQAEARQQEMKKVLGVDFEVMTFAEACGIQ